MHLVRVHAGAALPVRQDRAHGRILGAAEAGRLHDVRGRRLSHRTRTHPQGPGHLPQLTRHVPPLPPPQVVEELRPTQATECRPGQIARLHRQVAPQVQVGDEVRVRIRQTRVRGVRRTLVLRRALAHILDRQGRDDNQHLRRAPQTLGLQQHAPQTRVDRQTRQVPPHRRQPVVRRGAVRECVPPPLGRPAATRVATLLRRERPDLHEQGDAVAHRPRIGRVQEREILHGSQPQGRHLQDDGRQGGAQDLRLGEARAGQVVRLRIQADRHALGDAPAAARALVRARPADRLDREALDLRLVRIPRDARQPRVDHVADARDRQRRFRNVRGQHDPPQPVRLEHAVLLGGRQARVQRQDLDVPRAGALLVARAPAPSLQVVEERGLRLADVALAGQEDQDVPVALRAQLVHRVTDRGLHVNVLAHAVAQRRQLVVRVLQNQLEGACLGDIGGLDGLVLRS